MNMISLKGKRLLIYIKINHGYWADMVYLAMPCLSRLNRIYDTSRHNRYVKTYKWHIDSGLIGSIAILQKGLTDQDIQGSFGLKIAIGIGKGNISKEEIYKRLVIQAPNWSPSYEEVLTSMDDDLKLINYYNSCYGINLWEKVMDEWPTKKLYRQLMPIQLFKKVH